MKLLTEDRLNVLHRLPRWCGWTRWHYSVLDHSVIGGLWLDKQEKDPRPFLLHDFEESEFGDVISPVKKHIPATSWYFEMVDQFDRQLLRETGVDPDGGQLDEMMTHAEHLAVAVRGDPKYDRVPIKTEVAELVDLIKWTTEPSTVRMDPVYTFKYLWTKWQGR